MMSAGESITITNDGAPRPALSTLHLETLHRQNCARRKKLSPRSPRWPRALFVPGIHGVRGCLGRRTGPGTGIFPQILAPARPPHPACPPTHPPELTPPHRPTGTGVVVVVVTAGGAAAASCGAGGGAPGAPAVRFSAPPRPPPLRRPWPLTSRAFLRLSGRRPRGGGGDGGGGRRRGGGWEGRKGEVGGSQGGLEWLWDGFPPNCPRIESASTRLEP